MEKIDITSTSKSDKKNKSKTHSEKFGGTSEQEPYLHDEPEVKPRKSFWKNLFRRNPKKSDARDQKSTLVAPRLNAIFEEPKPPEEKEQPSEDIEAIKKTLKNYNTTESSFVLYGHQESHVTSNNKAPQQHLNHLPSQDDALIDFLSDTSSSTSSISMHKQNNFTIAQVEPAVLVAKQDEVEEEPRKDGYSFEYSETSEPSTEQSEEKLDDKQDNKVLTFDEKVEQKDTDSNIIMKDLNAGEIEPEIPAPEVLVLDELEIISEVSHEQIELKPDQQDCRRLDAQFSPSVGMVAQQPFRCHTAEFLVTSGSSGQPDVVNKFSTHSTQTLPAALGPRVCESELELEIDDEELLDEEHELWDIKLNELIGLRKSVLPTTVDVNSLDETDAGYREYRLDDFFKMIFRQTTDDNVLNYSVAYDPIFTNYNLHCYQPEKDLTFKSPDEKQKVVRKRKMMSLLNDKHKMAQYLREIEQEQLLNTEKRVQSKEELHEIQIVPQNSPTSKSNTSQNISNNENTLTVLETTKQKLQTYVQETICPENYLQIIKFINKNEIQKSDSLNNLKTNKKTHPHLNTSKSDTKTVYMDRHTTNTKLKEFRNVDTEIDNIFQELMTNMSELKESCILQGVEYNETEESEPLITITPLETSEELLAPIVDDILNYVFETIDRKNDFPGRFGSQTFSFVKEFGQIITTAPTVTINTPNDHFYSYLTLDESLRRSELFLNAIKDELSQYNPISYLATVNLNYFDSLEENNLINIQSLPYNSEYIPRICCGQGQEKTNNNSNTEVSSNSNSILETARNVIDNIQEIINNKEIEKSKKFGPYYNKKPGEAKDILQKQLKNTIDNIPEVTESLKHIFFGENSDDQILSEFNLVQDNFSKAGPSNVINSTATKSPNKFQTDNENNKVETIMENKSNITNNSSDTEDMSLKLFNFDQFSSSSNSQMKNNYCLERKQPDTNLHNHFPNLDPEEINKSIQDNLKKLKEKVGKIKKTNEKTVEILTGSSYSTPEGSLSILSTITENLENISRSSQERYPQYLSNKSLDKDKQ